MDHSHVCGANGSWRLHRFASPGSSPRMRGQRRDVRQDRDRRRIIPAYAGPTSTIAVRLVTAADHPRVCGANFFADCSAACASGSSPRMRGQPRQLLPSARLPRIIPAYAGPTSTRDCRGCYQSDHPRVCGANLAQMEGDQPCLGSSPRMRGQRPRPALGGRGDRIIPAYAGPTNSTSKPPCAAADHPRVCGANPAVIRPVLAPVGSSPRMRGQQGAKPPHGAKGRIIPAYAGPTAAAQAGEHELADHPRVCGANPCRVDVEPERVGSSPRMRGQPRHGFGDLRHARIIPAYAGPTRIPSPDPRSPSDHPRVCGANIRPSERRTSSGGSSPRMRGQHGRDHVIDHSDRIIPAYAGPTMSKFAPSSVLPDHPRVCGANDVEVRSVVRVAGSSPRMRGQPFRPCGLDARARIIPAYAGPTCQRHP